MRSLVVTRHLKPTTGLFTKVIHGVWNTNSNGFTEPDSTVEDKAKKQVDEFIIKFPEFQDAFWAYEWVERFQ